MAIIAKRNYITATAPELKEAIKNGRGEEYLAPLDEIEIPLANGKYVTAVCAFINKHFARFVFKDCWSRFPMNDIATNEGGYYGSEGRKHVLDDIYPYISQEWRDIITPRKLTETINGKKVEYSDTLWLPSGTDLFGTSCGEYWADEEDSFQLPIFKRGRNRVKEYGEEGTYPYWLRSVFVDDSDSFCGVDSNGTTGFNDADGHFGIVPGFDI